MEIHLSELEQEPRTFGEDFEVKGADLDDPVVAGPMAVHLEGSVRRIDGGFHVDGRMSVRGTVRCSRCTAPIPWESVEAFGYEMRPPAEAPTDEEVELTEGELEVVFLDGPDLDDPVLDLGELAVQQILLALPMKPLCDERCAGLCAGCGANLAAGERCTCGEEAIDPRWAPLQALKNDPDRS